MRDSLTMSGERTLTFPRIVYERGADYSYLAEALGMAEMEYSCVRVAGIGETMFGRTVYAVTLGNPDAPGVLYVGGIHAGDTQSTAALLRFIADYGEYYERGRRMYGVSMSYLNSGRCITVIPMLNPDGISVFRGSSQPLHRMDVPKEQWTGNGRNADLMADFETYCREPETCAVTGFVRTMGNVELLLGLHPAETGLSFDPEPKRSVAVGRLLSRMIGCGVTKKAMGAARWFAQETGKPAYTCATFEDAGTQPDDYISLYAAMREAMFSVPLLI